MWENTAHCGQHHSPSGRVSPCIEVERLSWEQVSKQACIHSLLSVLNYGMLALRSCCHDLLDMMDCNLGLWANQIPFSLKLHFVRVFNHGNENESKALTYQTHENDLLLLTKASQRDLGLHLSLFLQYLQLPYIITFSPSQLKSWSNRLSEVLH